MPSHRRARGLAGRLAGGALVVAGAALPWSWFAVRDVAGPLDVVAVALPQLAAGAVVVLLATALWLRAGRSDLWASAPAALALAASTAAAGLLATVGPWLPQDGLPFRRDGRPPVTVVVANIRFDNPTPAAVVDAVVRRGADVAVVPEATAATAPALRAAFPDVVETEPLDGKTVLVLSRHPLRDAVPLSTVNRETVQVTVDAS